MTDTIFVLNGPNLNMLGSTEPRIYGTQTLAEINAMLEQRAKVLKLTLDIRQSNHEGVLVDWLNEALAKASAVIINAGVYAREHFRRQSMIAQVARGSIVGLGALGYMVALDAAAPLCKGAAGREAK